MDMKNAFELLENILFIIIWKIFCILEENMIKSQQDRSGNKMFKKKVKC